MLRSSSSKTFKLAADLSLKFGKKARHAAPRRSLCSVLIFLPLRDLVIISRFLYKPLLQQQSELQADGQLIRIMS